MSENFIRLFDNPNIYNFAEPRLGMATADNNLFLKFFWEVIDSNIFYNCESRKEAKSSGFKWYRYAKGGDYRKWYGNNNIIVNWYNDGYEIQNYKDANGKVRSHNYNLDYIFKKGITWNALTSSSTSFRILEYSLFDNAGSSLFVDNYQEYNNMLGLLNSKIISYILPAVNPTLNYQPGTIGSLPFLKANVDDIVNICISLSKSDWDSFETSWDFQKHPMIMNVSRISDAYTKWSAECAERFEQLKSNEEELNRIFIDIYGLQDELTPEVADKDVTVNRFYDSKEAIPESMKGSSYALTKLDAVKSFISYAVGCMFGRYSLDKEGLVYAGGEWDDNNYRVFAADKDAIIPVCDDEYFEDDIVGRFINFVKVVYGESDLEENLQFIADTLGGNGSARDVIRSYFTSSFYADHCKTYQKRPIYWLFDSGKKNGFKCLVYMHRYQKDTIARIRTDYLHEQQARYRTAIADLQAQIAEAATSTRVRVQKQLKKLQEQADEALAYEEKIHHMADQMIGIDLDDGVKHNYEIFKDVLAKIK